MGEAVRQWRTVSEHGKAVRSRRTGKPVRYQYPSEKIAQKPLTAFFPPEHAYLADIVKLDTVENARQACEDLRDEYIGAYTRQKELRVMRAVILARNRATIMSRNPRLYRATRAEKAKIATIYKNLGDELKSDYSASYGIPKTGAHRLRG